ncbi:MAG: hypothetical protein HQ498_01140 [Pseudohongiella sp.]|nr:hypothetical protein [Pseudohongiella sp.]
MENLNTYAMLADIFGAVTIIVAATFAIIQLFEHKKRLRIEMAAEMCRKFSEPELARAVTLIKRLPDDISLESLQAMDREYEESAQIVGMVFETMGLLVYKKVASFELIQALTGGLLLMVWRKTGRWIKETREAESMDRFAEWVEWLAIQVESREKNMVPAYKAYVAWSG